MCYELSTEENESYFITLDSFCSNETCDEQWFIIAIFLYVEKREDTWFNLTVEKSKSSTSNAHLRYNFYFKIQLESAIISFKLTSRFERKLTQQSLPI